VPIVQLPPFRLIRNFLGAELSAGLLDHVIRSSTTMQASSVLDWDTGASRYDASRQSRVSRNLGEYEPLLKTRIAETVPAVRQELGLPEFVLDKVELELAAHSEGDHFHGHVDTIHENGAGRIMSAVYYFFAEPKRFSGGELRLAGWWRGDVNGKFPKPHQYITPENDLLCIFPSWAVHEVMPVVCPSGEFADSRFSVNCWLWRPLPLES
jgi:Rps23 Pro-64 3,4-dihydroxylase Tpa1-like proline 4-hydroxylase